MPEPVAQHAIAKPIVATVEVGPNYIFHLMAVAGVGFESEYATTYGASVEPEDLETLRALHGRLIFQDGHGGELASIALFIPVPQPWLPRGHR